MSDFEKHLIDNAKREKLRAEYKEKNYSFINEHRPADKPDSLDYTFDLHTMINYLEYVKQNAARLGIDNVKIKIGMGQYSTGHDPNLNAAYKGYQTVYLAPADGNSSDYEGECEIITEIDALNFSNICPPYSD